MRLFIERCGEIRVIIHLRKIEKQNIYLAINIISEERHMAS